MRRLPRATLTLHASNPSISRRRDSTACKSRSSGLGIDEGANEHNDGTADLSIEGSSDECMCWAEADGRRHDSECPDLVDHATTIEGLEIDRSYGSSIVSWDMLQ